MKIGILTFIDTINYGALLQAYALERVLTDMGHEVEIIQYKNKFIEDKEKNKKIFSLRWILRTIVIGKNFKRKSQKFERFESSAINKSKICSGKTIDKVCASYDKIITGSDQVWNLGLTGGDLHYFLDFTPDSTKKISYAPSFGESTIPDNFTTQIGSLLKGFHALSVREESGLSIISELAGRNAQVVLDPTLLLPKESWQKLATKRLYAMPYILVYLPHKKDICFSFARKIQEKTGYPIIYLSISPRIIRGVKTIYDASPEEWISWILYADYVITGSFHGTAFSLNLEKQFFFESLGTGSRIDNLVYLTGTNNRNLATANVDNIIDYNKVRSKLFEARQASLLWLKNALK